MPICEFHDFPKKIVCLRGPKNFVGEPFCVSQNFWYRKLLWIGGWGGGEKEGGSIKFFCQSFFVSQCRIFSWSNLSILYNFSGIEKLYR